MKGEVLRGHLDLLLLAALRPRPAHAYGMIKEIGSRSDNVLQLGQGTVYPALARLEEEGLITSRWVTQGGRKRRIYKLTNKGRLALGEESVDFMRFTKAVRAVLETP